MVFRLLMLLTLIGYTAGPDLSKKDDDDFNTSGKAFGTLLVALAGIGALILIALIVLAILSVTGQFESDAFNPLT